MFRGLIQNHEQLTWLHLITLSDLQLKNAAGSLSRQLHQITCFEGAHRVDIVGEFAFEQQQLNLRRRWSLCSAAHPASRRSA